MMPHRVVAWIGNRGIVLGLLGVIWVLTGVGLMAGVERRTGLLDEALPVEARAAAWITTGLLAVLAAGYRRLDDVAWPLLIVPVAARLFAYVWSLVGSAGVWAFGWAVPGVYDGAWRGAAVYAAVVLLVNRCAAGLDRLPARRETRGWEPRQ
jgi:hypothetical protein